MKSHGTHDVAHQVKIFRHSFRIMCEIFLSLYTIDGDIVFTSVATTCEAKALAKSSKFQVLW